ncbi:MAG: iron-sulfur cluster assembly protein [Bacteroidales bacterium]|nr:iron-sulfur cluster assembly protein [Bacteroidales bacterium]
MDKENLSELQKEIVKRLQFVYDPEIPVSVWDMGLIYAIDVDEQNNVKVSMTLTSPNCPVAESLPEEVKTAIAQIPEVGKVEVKIVFTPSWSIEYMSDEAKLELGFL